MKKTLLLLVLVFATSIFADDLAPNPPEDCIVLPFNMGVVCIVPPDLYPVDPAPTPTPDPAS